MRSRIRPSSSAFKNQELSVNIESLMIEQGRDLEETLDGHPDDALAAVTAGEVRRFDLPIVKDREPPR